MTVLTMLYDIRTHIDMGASRAIISAKLAEAIRQLESQRAGRPKVTSRCACGLYTLATAKKRGHKCLK